ncbi:MAG: hypothetical protein JWN56_76 [Sphingobacteriales bacterium]|nr:hypothetical protein [Sphingobacteriales bacterium]
MKPEKVPLFISHIELRILFSKSYKWALKELKRLKAEFSIILNQKLTIDHLSISYNVPVSRLEDAIMNRRKL